MIRVFLVLGLTFSLLCSSSFHLLALPKIDCEDHVFGH